MFSACVYFPIVKFNKSEKSPASAFLRAAIYLLRVYETSTRFYKTTFSKVLFNDLSHYFLIAFLYILRATPVILSEYLFWTVVLQCYFYHPKLFYYDS